MNGSIIDNGINIFNPINDNINDYLTLIKTAKAIEKPLEHFNYAIGEKSKSEVR